MKMNKILTTLTIKELEEKYPFIINYFEENRLNVEGFEDSTFEEYLSHFTEEEIEEWGIDIENIRGGLLEYISQMIEFLGLEEDKTIESLTIIAGTDKNGKKEGFEEFTINKSEIVSIVGPTGSGKSRLLADIEWAAKGYSY